MAVYQVSTREFRDNQKNILDMIDKGVQVIIRRTRGDKSYAITPIDDDDLYFTPEILAKIDKSIEQAKNGEKFVMEDNETLDDFLERTSNV